MVIKTSKFYKLNLELTQFQIKVLHGLMLGDLHAVRAKVTHNTRLCFDQGLVNETYARHLYELFSSLINMQIYTTTGSPDMRTGNV